MTYIVNHRNKKEKYLSFNKIADNLNRLGYKTITGKSFSAENTWGKYQTYMRMISKNK